MLLGKVYFEHHLLASFEVGCGMALQVEGGLTVGLVPAVFRSPYASWLLKIRIVSCRRFKMEGW